jgi:uncharacterized Zn finger protein
MRVLACAVLGVVLAGCGGGGRLTVAGYEQTLRDAGTELGAAEQKLERAQSKEAFKDDVDGVQHALDAAADKLDSVTPPQDAESANDRLVQGLRGLSKDFDELKSAADEGIDAATAKSQQIAAGAASRQAQAAIEELKRRGYDVGQLGT